MPTPVDFVGLNTIVFDKLDTTTNTIGDLSLSSTRGFKAYSNFESHFSASSVDNFGISGSMSISFLFSGSTGAVKFLRTGKRTSLELFQTDFVSNFPSPVTTFYNFDAVNFAFQDDVALLSASGSNIAMSFHRTDDTTYKFACRDSSNNFKTYTWSGVSLEYNDWNLICMTWNGNFNQNKAYLYINSNAALTASSTGTGTGLVRQESFYGAVLDGSDNGIQDFAFWNTELSREQANSLWSTENRIDPTEIDAASDLSFLHQYGEEPGNEITKIGKSYFPTTRTVDYTYHMAANYGTYGHVINNNPSDQAWPGAIYLDFTSSFYIKGNPGLPFYTIANNDGNNDGGVSYHRKPFNVIEGHGTINFVPFLNDFFVEKINNEESLCALNLHRNGPYNWPVFRQLNNSYNPVTRYHKNNNIFSYVQDIGNIRTTKRKNSFSDRFRERRGDLKQFREPVVSENKPLMMNVTIEEEEAEIFISANNENQFFLNEQINRDHNLFEKSSKETKDFVSLYKDNKSVLDTVNFVKFSDTIFPKRKNSNLTLTNQRERFKNYFWRSNRNERQWIKHPDLSSTSRVYYHSNIDDVTKNSLDLTGSVVGASYYFEDILDSRNYYSEQDSSISVGYNDHGSSIWPLDGVLGVARNNAFDTTARNGTETTTLGALNYSTLVPRFNQTASFLNNLILKPQYYYENNYFLNDVMYFSQSYNKNYLDVNHDILYGHENNALSYRRSYYTYNDSYKANNSSAYTIPQETNKEPAYNSYKEYSEEIRTIGKGYSILPEFRISQHVESILESKLDIKKYSKALLSISGSNSLYQDSSDDDFFEIYSSTDFLKNFEVLQNESEKIINPYKITLKCKAIKKLLPYDGFYPVLRSLQLSKIFLEDYQDVFTVSFDTVQDADGVDTNINTKKASLMQTLKHLYAPGIFYNTIKSGMAVDECIFNTEDILRRSQKGYLPINVTSSTFTTNLPYDDAYYLNSNNYVYTDIKNRLPFEAVLTPALFFKKLSPEITDNTQAFGSIQTVDQDKPNYLLAISNFLSETSNFFLENDNYTTLASLPEGDPNFGNAKAGVKYKMRMKVYTNTSGSKPFLFKNGVNYEYPQFSGSVKSKFWMYSNPSHFGPTFINNYLRGFHRGPGSSFSSSADYNPNISINKWKDFQIEGMEEIYFPGTYSSNPGYLNPTGAYDDYNKINFILKSGSFQSFGNNSLIGEYYHCTPPYYHGEAWADFSFQPTESKKYTLQEIMNNTSVEFCRYYDHTGLPQNNTASFAATSNTFFAKPNPNFINENALQIASSFNIFSRGILSNDAGGTSNVADQYRWIIQSKYETPMLNYSHLDFNSIEQYTPTKTYGTRNTTANLLMNPAIGCWYNNGLIPKAKEGVFVKLEEIPDSWTEQVLGGDTKLTGSLAKLCGFSSDPVKMGTLKETKVIKEAVVAVPFVERAGERKFFNLDRKDIKAAVKGETGLIGQSVIDQVERMKEFVFPPSMDFIANPSVDPFAMYIFEFTHTLSKQDLADIWQGLLPDIGRNHQTAEATISHELLAHELLGSGAKYLPNKDGRFIGIDRNARESFIEPDIQWMVFKVKQRASANYFEKMFETNETSIADLEELKKITATSTGAKLGVQYNWPYDFFSLVELVKIDAEVEFANAKTTDEGTRIEPVKIKKE